MLFRTGLLALVALLAASGPALAEAPKFPNALSCLALPSLMGKYYQKHVQYGETSPQLDERFVKLYSDRFDPSKSMLTETEFQALVAKVRVLLKDVRQGRCDAFKTLKTQQLKWHQEMEGFVKAFTETKDLKIDRTLKLQVDPDKRPRPKTDAERGDLRRKLLHFQLANYVSAGTKLEEARKKLAHRYTLVTRRIAEQTDAELYSGFLNAFSNALDPHSTYFSAEDLEDFRISMDLSLEGIGAVLSSRDGYTTVQEIVKGGAAHRQGQLKTKDKITAVTQMPNGEAVDVIDMALKNVVRLIRGKKGTQVKLTVLRQGDTNETLNVIITRDKIDLKEQAAKLRWETIERGGKALKLAIIDLPSFYGGDVSRGARDCTADIRRLLREVNAKGADGLLFDLSHNGGGLLKASVDISGLFIKKGPVVMINGPASPVQVQKDTDDSVQYTGPLVVLTSRLSASASEILAGAVKDYGRAVIVGDDHTFGKGTVQNIVSLPPGFGALKVTTALFFRPGGSSTQSKGVSADIRVPTIFNNDEYGERHQDYALPARTLDSFRGKDVNSRDPAKQWSPVTAADISALASLSAARVANDPEFKKVREKLEKRKKNNGVIEIAEILDDPDNKKKDDKKEDEDKLSNQAKEGLQVLADLVIRKAGARAALAPTKKVP